MARTPLRNKINRFFFKYRDKGVRNLMLFIAAGNAAVYLLYMMNRANPLFYDLLSFQRSAILRGQVWRLFTFPLCYVIEHGLLFGAIGMLFYYWCGMILEQYWGTLRFNLYYLSSVVLMDIAALLLKVNADVYYVNLSLFLAVATVMPEQQIRLWFVLPVKMKWLAWLDLGLTLITVIPGIVKMIHNLTAGLPLYLGWLLPLVPIANYLLFFGKQAADILPDFLRRKGVKKVRVRPVQTVHTVHDVRSEPVREAPRPRDNARFRCTVCGRTELTNPGLDFRYCSRCAGYRCYCEDHIHNHTHITE